jgi:signal transduction histidine kinase
MENMGRKILVVDDNLEFARIVVRILEDKGFQTSIAPDGNTAINKVLSESPELVLLDLKLPDISGEEMLKRIKEINEETAIIIITGYGGERVAVDLIKAGAMDFLSKPVEKEILLRAVENALKIRDAQIEDKQFERYSSLEKFFPFLAHEIRNPLHAIAGALTIIQRRSDLKDNLLTQSIKIIEEEVNHLNEFVQECLDFVRPPTKSQFIEVEINQVISVVINIISHIYGELIKKIRITTEIVPQLPKVYANYEEIKRAFLNIVKNSIEAMGEGGELSIKACFKSDPSPGYIEIVFIDNGSGIKKENIKHLFNPFFTTKFRGTGLGLAICRRIIVERHNGKVYIESEEGKGTKVTVALPIGKGMDISGKG